MVVEESLQECEKGRNTGTAAHGDDPRMDLSTTAKDPATPSVNRKKKKKKKRTKKATNQQSHSIPEAAAKIPSSRLAAYGFG